MNDGIKSGKALSLEGQPSRSLAAKQEIAMQLIAPQPIYCDCKDGCDVIVGHTKSLLTKEQFMEFLHIPPKTMTAEDVKAWVVELKGADDNLLTHARLIQLWREVMTSIAKDPTTRSATRALLEAALEL